MSAVIATAMERMARQAIIDQRDLEAYVDREKVGENVASIIHYSMEIAKRLASPEKITGDKLPWSKTWTQFRFRPGETTLWFGMNGHGKSAVTSQVALWLGLQGISSCIASFEMKPFDTCWRMLMQCAGNTSPSNEFAARFFLALAPRIFIYKSDEKVRIPLLFAAIRYCAEVKGCTHFFVDSLMKCVRKSDDYNAQKDFVDDLQRVGKSCGVHIHLVHHSRKLDNENVMPNKFDARGAGEISDQVDNVISIWRNKAKERDNQQALEMGAALKEEGPDFVLTCDKQRNGNWEGKWALWGDARTWHFRQGAKEPWQRGYELPVQSEPGANG